MKFITVKEKRLHLKKTKSMKKLLLISIMTLSFVMTSNAQDKKASDIKKLFELMKTDKMVDSMMEGMMPMLKKATDGKIMDDKSKEKVGNYTSFMMSEIKELSSKIINEEMPLIYDKHFTHKEIKDLIKFYKSSTGQKMLEKTPEITKDLMTSMISKQLPEFQEKLSKKLKE
jgi:hypothetical protein